MTRATRKQMKTDEDHERRIRWWREARFGMFVHWGLYALLGRSEWVMNIEQIPVGEYEKLAGRFRPRPRPARDWARLAKAAGMKYMVMTAKHHDGFCLWDTRQTDYNSAKRGPGRDLVREYVEACREFGLKAGLYYSLMDWHHPDGARCATDKRAYERFIAFTHGCVRELMSNYGKIDILWYDLCWPFTTPAKWQSRKMNAMARRLQPDILINDRALEPEDFDTRSEGHVRQVERDWEACMTTCGSWGYVPCRPEQWQRPSQILGSLRAVTAGGGNLLLNIGPKPDGSVPAPAVESLTAVGKWLRKYGSEVVYGQVDRVNMRGGIGSRWTRKGNNYYLWCFNWHGTEQTIGRLKGKVLSAELLPEGRKLRVEQTPNRVVIKGLPAACPDKTAGVPVIRMTFASRPRQDFGLGYVILPFERKKK